MNFIIKEFKFIMKHLKLRLIFYFVIFIILVLLYIKLNSGEDHVYQQTPQSTTPKSTTPKPTTPKSTTPKPATPKPTTPKPATPKPAMPNPTTPTTPNNGSDYLEILLGRARAKIKAELGQYDFSIAGVNRLEDLTLENGRQPLRTLVLSAQRSGSTFFGSLLSSTPGTYFYNEGLRPLSLKTIRQPSKDADWAVGYMKHLLQCKHHKFYEIHKNLAMFLRNQRLWEYCEQRNDLYFNPNVTYKMCRLFPFQVMKLVRIRLQFLEELLKDSELNVRVIYLVRDPRAVMHSRYSLVEKSHETLWPNYKEGTFPPEQLCGDMASNYRAAAHFQQNYPGRFMVVRFEELMADLDTYSKKLLDFMRLRETPQWKEFINAHTNQNNTQVYNIYRVSKDVPYQWKKKMDFERIQYVQMVCAEAMKLWGYKPADTATQVQDDNFNPLQDYSLHL